MAQAAPRGARPSRARPSAGGGAARLAAADAAASGALFRAGRAAPRAAWVALELTGDGGLWIAAAVAATLAPSASASQRHLAANLLTALLIDLVAVGACKAALRRARPAYNADAGDMRVVVAVDAFSCPSGHASRAAMLAALAAAALPPAFAAPAAAWALGLALSRVAMGRHYLGDVVAGLLLGTAVAAALLRGGAGAGALPVPPAAADAAVAAARRPAHAAGAIFGLA
jgi:undecaprenyl-diphosphatase